MSYQTKAIAASIGRFLWLPFARTIFSGCVFFEGLLSGAEKNQQKREASFLRCPFPNFGTPSMDQNLNAIIFETELRWWEIRQSPSPQLAFCFHLLRNMFAFPPLVSKGIYHHWTYLSFFFSRKPKQMEVNESVLHCSWHVFCFFFVFWFCSFLLGVRKKQSLSLPYQE